LGERPRSRPLRSPFLLQSVAMANLASLLNQLQPERNRLSSQLEQINKALSALNVKGSRRGMSAAAKARIAAAQKARWAKWRKAKKKGQSLCKPSFARAAKESASPIEHPFPYHCDRCAIWFRISGDGKLLDLSGLPENWGCGGPDVAETEKRISNYLEKRQQSGL
jgi:hypothetical protein